MHLRRISSCLLLLRQLNTHLIQLLINHFFRPILILHSLLSNILQLKVHFRFLLLHHPPILILQYGQCSILTLSTTICPLQVLLYFIESRTTVVLVLLHLLTQRRNLTLQRIGYYVGNAVADVFLNWRFLLCFNPLYHSLRLRWVFGRS